MIKILIVDDHRLFRQSLRAVIESAPDMAVLAEAGDGIEALEILRDKRPDIVLMDVEMPGMDGIEATRQIRSLFGSIKVIALSSHAEAYYTEKMRQAGAHGFISKICSRADLIASIRSVCKMATANPSPGDFWDIDDECMPGLGGSEKTLE